MASDTRASAGSNRSYRFASAILFTAILSCFWGGGTALAAGRADIPGSFVATTDVDAGELTSANMAVEIALAPGNPAALSKLLADVYNPQSPRYHQWLARGEFDARFAPSGAVVAAITSYLRSYGLTVQRSSSPFLLRVSGPSSTLESAFDTSIHNFRNARGVRYFANASALRLPADLISGVLGVVGMTNTVRLAGQYTLASHAASGNHAGPKPSCEAPYPTAAQFFAYLNDGTGFYLGYGASVECNGLTPAQTNSIYGAPAASPVTQGSGVNLAVFELSAYQQADIQTWAHTFYGPGYSPSIVDVNVDGGPLNIQCPAGDECLPQWSGYSGDLEVEADVEMQLTMAPAASHIYVYNAPNDWTGQTGLDEYSRIAADDVVDVVSSSWGVCENDAGAALAQAENVIFEKLALQGQSVFAAAGDTGAFDCIRDGTGTMVNVMDPASQPWVTSVGGTSFESYNPGSDQTPAYPQSGEAPWNVDNLCNTSANEGGYPGLFWCGELGVGGGGISQFWGRPAYQSGPGVTNSYTVYGNGTTQCSLAASGTPCREVPDVSADADPYTGYAEYCTGDPSTNSECAAYLPYDVPAGWFVIGGTSLSAPLWSGIIADRDGVWHNRIGNANPMLYSLYRSNYREYLHDVTGKDHTATNNGLFPAAPGYDMATGIGTPKMTQIILQTPEF